MDYIIHPHLSWKDQKVFFRYPDKICWLTWKSRWLFSVFEKKVHCCFDYRCIFGKEIFICYFYLNEGIGVWGRLKIQCKTKGLCPFIPSLSLFTLLTLKLNILIHSLAIYFVYQYRKGKLFYIKVDPN